MFGCASTAYSKKIYWVYMWTATPLKLCEQRATKESDQSVGARLSMQRTPSLEFWECNENMDYAVGTNIFVGIRVLSVLALCADFDTHLQSILKSFSVGYGHSRSTHPILIMKFQQKHGFLWQLRTDRQTSIYKGIGYIYIYIYTCYIFFYIKYVYVWILYNIYTYT